MIMPNGSPNFEKEELPLLEAFFAKISSVLDSFANNHNMLITKYYHQGPSWNFQFKHPTDGVGKIDVQKSDNDTVYVGYGWWIDDYDTSTRFMKFIQGKNIGIDHGELRQVLEDALEDILQWQKDELTPHKAPHPWSKRCSKEQFYKQYENLPDLEIKK